MSDSELISALKRRIGFDEGSASDEFIHPDQQYFESSREAFLSGANWQSEQLKPVLLAMVENYERLENLCTVSRRVAEEIFNDSNCEGQLANEFMGDIIDGERALARLKEAVSGEDR